MCKVTQYHFTCHHHHKHLHSRCHGTKVKRTRTSAKAACCSEPYIHIRFSSACSKCQQDAWLLSWQRKLEKAIAFRDGLREKRLPGEQEVAVLVGELEEVYAREAWDVNRMFPHVMEREMGRVKLMTQEDRECKRLSSLLEREVKPHEVVLREKQMGGWIENDDDDDEEDLVRSTDPLHPISTDYNHPLDGGDDSWLLDQYTAEELERSFSDDNDSITSHTFENSWDWGIGTESDKDTEHTIDEWNGNDMAEANDTKAPIAWGPEADDFSSSAQIGLDGTHERKNSMNAFIAHEEKNKMNASIEKVIESFWEVVNGDINTDIDTKDQQAQYTRHE